MHAMASFRKGYTLAELVLVCIMLGILAAVAIPRMNMGLLTKYKGQSTAKTIMTDLRLARSMAISSAPTNSAGFGIKMVGSSPYTSYTLVDLSNGAVISTHQIDSGVQCTGGSIFYFGPMGNLKTGSSSTLVVNGSGSTTTITIIPATGSVTYAQ